MKSIAVFLILNILLLSSFSGMANIRHGKASCCTAKTQKNWCKQSKHNAKGDCETGDCNALLSCGTSGYIVDSCVSVSPAISTLSGQLVHPFVIGELSDYHGNGWNPPKA